MKYCTSCGIVLERKKVEQKYRLFCPKCQCIYYDRLKVGAGGLIEQDKKLLLLQRTNDPFRECWNLPAGYAEVDENPLQTAIREVYEETRLRVKVESLVDIYFFTDDPRGNGILIVYKCKPIGGKLTETLEGVKPTFFTASNIPKDLAGGGHNQAINAWKERKHTKM